MDRINLQIIREAFGKVAYSHKTHEKGAEIADFHSSGVKVINVVLTTATSSTLLVTLITNQTILGYITAIISALTLAFIIFQLSFNPEQKAEKHRQAAKELWRIREKYLNLIADIMSENISNETITHRRDQLMEELKMVYQFSPATSSKAYKKAQDTLKLNEELTFSTEEIDQLLPENLRIVKSLKDK